MMKRLIIQCLALCCVLTLGATEPQKKFSPEKYQADMEQFITREASLSPQEAAAFFPLLREMLKKQRSLYNQMKAEGKIKPADEESCRKLIQKRDQMELELKSIQQVYHNKFLNVLSASKVYDVIKAQDRFHRRMFKNWGRNGNRPAPKKEP